MNDGRPTILGLAFSPEGKALFIERHDEPVAIWSVATRTSRSTKPWFLGDNLRIAPAPGQLYVASGFSGAYESLTRFHAFDMHDPESFELEGEKIAARHEKPGFRHRRSRRAQVIAAVGKVGVAASASCETPLWDVDRGVFPHTLEAKPSPEEVASCGEMPGNSWGWASESAVVGDSPPGGETLFGYEIGGFEPLPPSAPKGAVVVAEAAGTLAWVGADGAVRVGPRAGPFREIGKQHTWDDYRHADPNPRIALSPKGELVGFRAGVDRAEILAPTPDQSFFNPTAIQTVDPGLIATSSSSSSSPTSRAGGDRRQANR